MIMRYFGERQKRREAPIHTGFCAFQTGLELLTQKKIALNSGSSCLSLQPWLGFEVCVTQHLADRGGD